MSKVKRSRGWCFTINNWTDDDLTSVMAMYKDIVECTYLIIGFEKGRCKTPHLQCYIYYTNPVRWKSMKVRLPKKAHFEAQKAKANVKGYYYCMEELLKTKDFYEFGERPRQGHRTDIAVMMSDIINGDKTKKQVVMEYRDKYATCFRSIDKAFELFRRYDTQFILYEDASSQAVHHVYDVFDETMDLLIDTPYVLPNKLYSELYSRKYRYIFYPTGLDNVQECIMEIAHGIIRPTGWESFYDEDIE